MPTENDLNQNDLEPLAEVEGALLVVEVLHLPHPKLGSLLRGGEHSAGTDRVKSVSINRTEKTPTCNALRAASKRLPITHAGSCRDAGFAGGGG